MNQSSMLSDMTALDDSRLGIKIEEIIDKDKNSV